MKILLTFVVLLLLLAGCSTQNPESVASDYMSALMDERWESACHLLTEESLQAVEGSGEPCSEHLQKAFQSSANSYTSDNVEIISRESSSASVRTDLGNILLLKKPGGWRIDLLP